MPEVISVDSHFDVVPGRSICRHCGRVFKQPKYPRASSSRTGQYGMGFTATTAYKGILRSQLARHLRACKGRAPNEWPVASERLA